MFCGTMQLYMLGVSSLKEAEGSKTKKKNTYTLMLFVDSKEGRIRQMSIGPGFIESVMVIGLAVMIILGVFCYRYKTSIKRIL